MKGGTTTSNVPLLTPEQQSFLSSVLGEGEIRQGFQRGYSSLLTPPSAEETEAVFQRSVVEPTMRQYQRQVLPAIESQFGYLGAGSSSALNQALQQSAEDISSILGGQYGNIYQQQQQNLLAGLSGLGGLATQSVQQPVIAQRQGILGPLIQTAGSLGGAYLMSSKDVKENIKEYKKGLEVFKDTSPKMYDYKAENGGAKDCVGMIAEDLPEEITQDVNGIKHVDLYGLLCISINAIKELSERLEKLEAK